MNNHEVQWHDQLISIGSSRLHNLVSAVFDANSLLLWLKGTMLQCRIGFIFGSPPSPQEVSTSFHTEDMAIHGHRRFWANHPWWSRCKRCDCLRCVQCQISNFFTWQLSTWAICFQQSALYYMRSAKFCRLDLVKCDFIGILLATEWTAVPRCFQPSTCSTTWPAQHGPLPKRTSAAPWRQNVALPVVGSSDEPPDMEATGSNTKWYEVMADVHTCVPWQKDELETMRNGTMSWSVGGRSWSFGSTKKRTTYWMNTTLITNNDHH